MRFLAGLWITLLLAVSGGIGTAIAEVTNDGAGTVTGRAPITSQVSVPSEGRPTKSGSSGRPSTMSEELVVPPEGPEAWVARPWPQPSLGDAVFPPTAAEVARLVVVRLRLPDPTPQFGPDPSANEWQMIPVGYPVWLWTEGPDDLSATTQAYGYTFTLRAERTSTVFTLGDGHSQTCTVVTPYTAAVTPGSASPTCGYTYAEPSRPGPDYAVSATTRWRVTWTAAGESGVITATHTGNSTLAVGELFALVTK